MLMSLAFLDVPARAMAGSSAVRGGGVLAVVEGARRTSRAPGDVLVQDGEGHVAEQRGED